MNSFLTRTLERALNKTLALDPESAKRLKKLDNKRVTLDLQGFDLSVQLFFFEGEVQIIPAQNTECDTHISGKPLTLLRMSLTRGDRKHFFADDVTITGNLDLGQDVIDLFDRLEIDWEEIISRYTGDVTAYQLGRIAKGIKKTIQQTHANFLQNVNEYVHEEKEWFPTKETLHDFFDEIDELRMDVDRVGVRVERIKKEM